MAINVLNNLVVQELDNGAFGISVRASDPEYKKVTFKFLGASVRASVQPGEECSALTLYPKENDKCVLAIHIAEDHKETGGKRGSSLINMNRATMLVEVKKGEAKPKPFFPAKRVGSTCGSDIYTRTGIEATLDDGSRYCTNEIQGAHLVPDPNLLCRYLAEMASEDDVRVASQKYLETNEEVIEGLHALVQRVSDTVELLEGENKSLRSQVHHLNTEKVRLERLSEEIQLHLSEAIDRISGALKKWIDWSNDIRDITTNKALHYLCPKLKNVPVRESISSSRYYVGALVQRATRERLGLPLLQEETDQTKAA